MNDLHQVRQQAFHGESSLRNVVVSCLKHEGVSILVIKPLKKIGIPKIRTELCQINYVDFAHLRSVFVEKIINTYFTNIIQI